MDGFVFAPGGQGVAVWAEGDDEDSLGWPGEGGEVGGGVRVGEVPSQMVPSVLPAASTSWAGLKATE